MLLIAYYRVAKARQALGSPGLDAQHLKVEQLCQSLLQGGEKVAKVVSEFTEIKSSRFHPKCILR